jgi:hypothetical protein
VDQPLRDKNARWLKLLPIQPAHSTNGQYGGLRLAHR